MKKFRTGHAPGRSFEKKWRGCQLVALDFQAVRNEVKIYSQKSLFRARLPFGFPVIEGCPKFNKSGGHETSFCIHLFLTTSPNLSAKAEAEQPTGSR
jgi:hypothetical protein